jgi:hypothetical protein
MAGDRIFSFSGIKIPEAAFYMASFTVLFLILWTLTSLVFSKIYNADINGELKINSFIFGLPSLTIAALPVFLKLNSRLSTLDLKVLGWVYKPSGGFVHFMASGYFILLILAVIIMSLMFTLMVRFTKRLHDESSRFSDIQISKMILTALFVFMAVTTAYVTVIYPPTGDEPHYLTIAQSIGNDLDVNLENQYMTDKTYRSFYPVELPYESLHTAIGKDGKGMYSNHNAGVSFLMAPFLKVGGRLGVGLLMNALCAILGTFLFLFLRHIKISVQTSVFTSIIFSITSPVLMSSSLALTEIPAALLILFCAVYMYCIYGKDDGFYDIDIAGIRIKHASVIYFLSIGAMTWLHSKLIFMSVIFYAVYYVLTIRKKKYIFKMEILNNLSLGVVAVCFGLYYFLIYGKSAATGSVSILKNNSFFFIFDIWNFIKSFFAIMFDRNYGIIIYNPLFIISIWGALLAWQKKNFRLLIIFLITVPYYSIFLFWSDWTGSMIPARQMVPMAMLWAVFYAYFIDKSGFQATKTFKAMFSITMISSFVMMSCPPLRYAVSKEKIYAALGSVDKILLWIFPSFAKNPPVMDIMAVFYFIGIIFMYRFFVKANKR